MWSFRVPLVALLCLWTVQGFIFVPGVVPSTKLRRGAPQGGISGINGVLGASHSLRMSMSGADSAEGAIVETHFAGAGTILVSNRQGKEACILLYDCSTERASGVRLGHTLSSILASASA